MTDYRKSGKNKKVSISSKGKAILSFFIVMILVFAILNGFIRAATIKNKVSKSGWDGISSFVVALKDNPNSLFIFQKDPRRAVVLKTGILGKNLEADTLSKTVSVVFGTNVNNYLNAANLSDDQIKKKFENFTSFITPFKILTTGWGGGDMNTNISRIDAFRLWWQLKSIRSKDLDFVNLTSFKTLDDGSDGQKVLGVTSDYLSKEVSTYLENTKIIQEDLDIIIVNSSDDDRSSFLASNFITIVGGRVVAVNGDLSVKGKCLISTNQAKSYTVIYLAKVFTCDIKDTSQTDDKPNATIYLGQDFPARYF